MSSRPNPLKSPRTLDLFCGIGGLTLGLQRAGFTSVGGVDHWEDALATFSANLDVPSLRADLKEVELSEIETALKINRSDIDVVVGGPPCQGFSTVGKRESSDPRNTLWKHFVDLVSAIRPAYVLIENVEGLVVMDRGQVVNGIISAFGEIGYRMKARLLISANYGVPQLRKRVVFLGWLDGLCEPSHPSPLVQPHVTVGEAIFDLPELAPGESAGRYTREPLTPYQAARRGLTAILSNHEAAKHPDSLVEVLRHIPDGGNRRSIPDNLQPKSGFHNSYARLASDKPAIAVTSNMRKPSSARATHPKQHRGLTVREGLRLQSFDDSFVPVGSRTAQYLQVGNAVPPLLAQAVGESLMAAWRQNSASAIRRARAQVKAVVIPSHYQQHSLPTFSSGL